MKLGSKQQKNFDKFVKIAEWMCSDIYRSIFDAKANFLVAMGLLNYIEVVGSFYIGTYEKDNNGKCKVNKKGRKIETSSTTRFNTFFGKMGAEYLELLSKHPSLYSDLRCGLTHEYLIKNSAFCVYGCSERFTESEMDRLVDPSDRSQVAKAGVVYEKVTTRSKKWHILNAKLYIDFKRAVLDFQQEILDGKNTAIKNNFFERCNKINMINFL